MEDYMTKALNIKLILSVFEKLSRIKINFHKSELFCFGQAKERVQDYRELFGCDEGSLPMRYLGIPIHFRKLKNSERKEIEDRFKNN
jgi:hypothetical protein